LRISHARRYREITNVLTRHGLGFLSGALGFHRLLPVDGLMFWRRGTQPITRPEHVRMAFEELGCTFVKLGQILSTRADLLPPSYQLELSKLQDTGPALKDTVVREIISTELGRPLEEVFSSFDSVPLACASIGQVHAATLLDGTEVAIKIRRPGIVEEIELDLEILEDLAAAAKRRWQLASHYDVVGLANEFAQTLRAETDYIREGRNADRFWVNFNGDKSVHVPRPFWGLTTQRVLTLERIHGIKIDDLGTPDSAGVDRVEVASRGARMVLKMIFKDGFFHADPHPGNFFIEPGGRIGLVDFGMVGTVDVRAREQLIWALVAFIGTEADRQVDALYDVGVARKRVDRAWLRRDLEQLHSRYYGKPIGDIPIRALLVDVLGLIRRHHLQLPANFALLAKTVMMHEGLVRQLDPSFNFTAVLVPYARRMIGQQYSPASLARSLGNASLDAARLGLELPHLARRILGDLERGEMEVAVRPAGFEPLLRRVERIANRIVLGIIAASFVIGLAVLLSAYHVRQEQGPVIILVVGFVLASAVGAYVAWGILRSGRS
jgi:ubiquinone biosynthesis protein